MTREMTDPPNKDVELHVPPEEVKLRITDGPVRAAVVPGPLHDLIQEVCQQRNELQKSGDDSGAKQREEQILEVDKLLFPPVPQGLTVDLEEMTVTLGHKTWLCASEAALRWVKVLAERRGEWVAASALGIYNQQLAGARPHQFKRYLPEQLRRMIESSMKQGSCLKRA